MENLDEYKEPLIENEDLDEEEDNDDEKYSEDIEDNIRIFTDQADREIFALYGRCKKGKLILRPTFQRKFVWDDIKCSRLIESALLHIPLPMIYLSEEKDGNLVVIDGQQRLTAFFNYIDGVYSLKGLENLRSISESKNGKSKVKGKYFKDLSEKQQDRIQSTEIRVITFKKECDENLKFDIFKRLNTGAVSLNTQELRNCVYHGKYNDLLRELAELPAFKTLLEKSTLANRMLDVELVLRFTSLYHRDVSGSLKRFMTEDMAMYKDTITDSHIEELKNVFKATLAINKTLFGEKAFRNYYLNETNNNGSWGAFSPVLYEVLMVSLSKYSKNMLHRHLDEIREAWMNLIVEKEFRECITQSTTSERNVKKRLKMWNDKLDIILANEHEEPRCFSYELKKEMYVANSTCSICGQHIATIDDAAVDHIEQYWLGGRTIPDNARLAHRFCNNSRPRIERPKIIVEESDDTPITTESAVNDGLITNEALLNYLRES